MIAVFVLIMIMISSLPAGLVLAADSVPPEYMVKPGCTDFKCGNFTIPYPFGMGEGCYSTTWFSVNCNPSFHPPKLFLNHSRLLNLEVLNISLEYQTVTVNSPISSLCNSTDQAGKTSSTETKPRMELNRSPFWFSMSDNIFMVLGCGSARLMNQSKSAMAGCGSICPADQVDNDTKECFGVNCCQTTISSTYTSVFKNYSMSFRTEGGNVTGCMAHALLVDRVWFSGNFSSRAIIQTGYAPLSLLWGIEKHDRYANNHCVSTLYSYCDCRFGTEGNPFLKNGCRDVKECAHCSGTCDYGYNHNSKKSYYFCNTKNRIKALILDFAL